MIDAKCKSKGKGKGKSKAVATAYTEVDRLGLATVGLFSIVVGGWALVCLGSLIATEGLLGTFSGFFKAIVG